MLMAARIAARRVTRDNDQQNSAGVGVLGAIKQVFTRPLGRLWNPLSQGRAVMFWPRVTKLNNPQVASPESRDIEYLLSAVLALLGVGGSFWSPNGFADLFHRVIIYSRRHDDERDLE